MKKALMVATVEDFFNFELNDINILQDMEYEVHLAANSENVQRPIELENVKKHHIPFSRSPFGKSNIAAYKKLKMLVISEGFELIHCHTPVGGVMGRLVGHKYGIKTIYTAHGFHFFKGAPFLNWCIYYPIEKFLARWTDILITINKEDYELAKKKMHAKQIEYVPGVGVDTEKFESTVVDRSEKRKELGIPENAFLLLSVGELNKNKNHEIVIRALAKLNNSDMHYVIVGKGDLYDYLIDMSRKLGIEKQVHLVGFRNDVKDIYKASDLFVFPSFREGLSVSLMEAIASKIPVICSNIRGNVDLVIETSLFNPTDVRDVVDKISNHVSMINIKEVNENYINLMRCSSKEIVKRMNSIYSRNYI